AGMDLALGLVEADHGVEIARAVARWLVIFMQRPGGQSQFSERLARPIPTDSAMRAVLDEIVVDPRGDHSVPRMAERAALSERHFARVFIAETARRPRGSSSAPAWRPRAICSRLAARPWRPWPTKPGSGAPRRCGARSCAC